MTIHDWAIIASILMPVIAIAFAAVCYGWGRKDGYAAGYDDARSGKKYCEIN